MSLSQNDCMHFNPIETGKLIWDTKVANILRVSLSYRLIIKEMLDSKSKIYMNGNESEKGKKSHKSEKWLSIASTTNL